VELKSGDAYGDFTTAEGINHTNVELKSFIGFKKAFKELMD